MKYFICSLIALVLTFFLGEILSIYSFGTIPTLLTSLYLISMFLILDYLLICGVYIISKLVKKEKIGIKKIIGLILIFIFLILVLYYIIVLNIDYLHWYVNSSPFYFDVIFRGIEILLPGIIMFIIGGFCSYLVLSFHMQKILLLAPFQLL